MHDSARKAALAFFSEYEIKVNAKVLEVGSLSVNGGMREFLPDHSQWVGVDLTPGVGVDIVLEDAYSLPFDSGEFDVAVATSVFEHAELFWLSFLEMVRVVRPGGYIYLCSPSNGHIHRYPVDCYRFYPDAGPALAKWAHRSGFEVSLLESLVLNKDQSEWNDWCAVFRVGPNVDERVHVGSVERLLGAYAVHTAASADEELKVQATQDQVELALALANWASADERSCRGGKWHMGRVLRKTKVRLQQFTSTT